MSKKLLAICSFLLCSTALMAQTPQMADAFREEGKIYVVIAVIITILIGLFVFLFILDKKVNKLHKAIQQHNS